MSKLVTKGRREREREVFVCASQTEEKNIGVRGSEVCKERKKTKYHCGAMKRRKRGANHV